jgi:hypothetical protein
MLMVLAATPVLAETADPFHRTPQRYTQDGENYEPQQSWKENATGLPPYPLDADFTSFYVSAAATSQFYVDIAHITLGTDGVVRYALLIVTPSGARNLRYEGMRCQTREWRVYALGRANHQTWAMARSDRWLPIRDVPVNRQHAALFQDFFCPDGLMASRLEAVVAAFKKEGSRLPGQP